MPCLSAAAEGARGEAYAALAALDHDRRVETYRAQGAARSVGVQAELIGEGVLVCRGSDVESAVAVRKTARGQVELEGTVCDVYYKVRKEIYGLHALVSS